MLLGVAQRKMLHLRVGCVLAAERQLGEDHFRAGYQDAVAEVLRFLVEVHGYGPGDGLCVQLAAHMQRHCEAVGKGKFASTSSSRKLFY